MSKQTDFINSVKQGAINGWKEYKVLPSLTISQAILESGWGGSGLSTQANNFFGIKADSSWTGAYVIKNTREVYNGKETYVDAKFRKYATKDDSVEDHAKFIVANKRYANIIGETNYVKATKAIQEDGYATDPNYASLLQSIIESNNLTIVDHEAFGLTASVEKPVQPAPVVVESHESLSVVDYLKSIGQDSSLANRKKLASEYGISPYSGTANQNVSLLNALQKPKPVVVAPVAPNPTTHTVVSGDNLSELAVKYNTTVANLQALNGIENPSLIKIGQVLKVSGSAPVAPRPVAPSPVYYIVVHGDNLTKIAKKYSTTISAISSMNGITNPSLIRIGQRLRVR